MCSFCLPHEESTNTSQYREQIKQNVANLDFKKFKNLDFLKERLQMEFYP